VKVDDTLAQPRSFAQGLVKVVPHVKSVVPIFCRHRAAEAQEVVVPGEAADLLGHLAPSLFLDSIDVTSHFRLSFAFALVLGNGPRFWMQDSWQRNNPGILYQRLSLNRSSLGESRWYKVALKRAFLVAGIVAGLLAQQALRHAVTLAHNFVGLSAFEVVCAGVVGPSTFVASDCISG
jgi:hypothetical protein